VPSPSSTVFKAIGRPYYDATALVTGSASTILKAIGTAMEKHPLSYQYERILAETGPNGTMKIEVRMYITTYATPDKKEAQARLQMRIGSINEELDRLNVTAKSAEKPAEKAAGTEKPFIDHEMLMPIGLRRTHV